MVEGALSLSSQYRHSSQILRNKIQIQHNRIKNPNWQEAISWLFISVAGDLNSGRPRDQMEQVPRAGLEPGTAGLRVRRTYYSSATLPLLMFMSPIFRLKTAPGNCRGKLQGPFLPSMSKALNNEIVRQEPTRWKSTICTAAHTHLGQNKPCK